MGAVVVQPRHARGGSTTLKAGGHRARAERTENMPLMLLTLDVSKPSGWLNVDALCRVEKMELGLWGWGQG